VLDGDSAAPSKKEAHPSIFGPCLYVCIRIPFRTEVGLNQATLCLMGTQLPPEERAQPHPIFSQYLLWRKGWMDQDGT